MKPGDKVEITNYKDDSYQIATVVEVFEECVSVQYENVGGIFTFSKRHVRERSIKGN